MQLTTFTFNVLYMIYFIGTVVTTHSLNKTPRKKVDCIITWMLICLIMLLCSFIFISIDKELFPSVDMKNDLFLLTNLIPLLAYKHLFPNNSIRYNIFSYFTIASVYTIMLMISRTLTACIFTIFGGSLNILTVLLFAFLVVFSLYYEFNKLRYVISETIESLHGTLSHLAIFSFVAFFGIHFLVDVWEKWTTMNYHLFLKDLSIIIMPSSAFIFLFASLKNLSEKEKYEKDTYQDELTGIGNRRKLMVDLLNIDESEISEKDQYYMIYMDLDFFKTVNDNFGHEVGDRYLISFVDIIKRYFGQEYVYRMSGDEFVGLLKNKPHQSQNIKESLEEVFKEGFTDKIGFNFLGASVGVVEIYDHNHFQQYINDADHKMYENKEEHHKFYKFES